MIVGITGNYFSGKSAVADIFSKIGFATADADEIGHDILENDFGARESVIKNFGSADRKKLRDKVFSSKKAMGALCSIMWPKINDGIREFIKSNKGHDIAIEAAVLFEAGWDKLVDKTVCVVCSDDIIRKRIKRAGVSIEDYVRIRGSQMRENSKSGLSDLIIDNSGTLGETKEQAIKIIALLRKEQNIKK